MQMKCEPLGDADGLRDVVLVRVPGIYPRGDPLPTRMARLVRPAAAALQHVYEDVVKGGGHLYISDAFRSAAEQHKAHLDFVSGRKTSFSPDTCSSVHEAARAIDIDAFDTGIGHKKVREILNKHGWVNITPSLTASECWHYEFREQRWEKYKAQHGYAAMAHAMKEEIGNLLGAEDAQARNEDVKWLQASLNKLLQAHLVVDGVYGPQTKQAVIKFQQKHGLQADGVAGPITKGKIKELLGKT
jgi:hypothetical protein